VKQDKRICVIGGDISTTALSMGGRTEEGQEVFVSTPMLGPTKWRDQPAFDLHCLPGMLEICLEQFEAKGFTFAPKGALSWSVRQHDLTIIDRTAHTLMPALSWQCNAAKEEVTWLRQQGAENSVGWIAERFILPKLMWVLRQKPDLQHRIGMVMPTGDYLNLLLTGSPTISTSDGLSNGLLRQDNKALAAEILELAGFELEWFPRPIQSGTPVGQVKELREQQMLYCLCRRLKGWQVIADLGDNHAGAVGCGLADDWTIVVSAGTSGTVSRRCDPKLKVAEGVNCFEYYQNRLLLLMLADCAAWYNRFVEQFTRDQPLGTLDDLASNADISMLVRIRQKQVGETWEEVYPIEWSSLSLPVQVASTQLSIAARLAELVKQMINAVPDENATAIKRVVLTGGLSQSKFFRRGFHTALEGLGIKLE